MNENDTGDVNDIRASRSLGTYSISMSYRVYHGTNSDSIVGGVLGAFYTWLVVALAKT